MAIFEVLNNQQSYFNRYFRRNVGDDDYATHSSVTVDRIVMNVNPSAGNGNTGLPTGAPAVTDNVMQTIDFSYSGTISELYRNGSDYFKGIIANVEYYLAGELIHSWSINSNSSTESDSVGGLLLTFINGNADDWGLFDRQANGDWLGQELVVNGEFDSDLSGWEVTEAGQTVEWDNGRLHIITDGTGCGVRQVLLSDNITYQVALNYEAVSGGLKYQVGASSYALNSTQSVLSDHLADGANFFLYRGIGAGEGYFDNVSVKEVLKNA